MEIGIKISWCSGAEPVIRKQKGKSLLELLDDYCVIDTETTGLSPVYDSLIEVAACRVVNGNIVEKFSSLINPGFELDEFITELTGITNDMLRDAPEAANVLKDFRSFVGDSVLIGHNVNFDINFLYDSCMELFNEPFSNNFVDTMRLARRVCPELEHFRLSDMVKHYKISHTDVHRALGDVLATKELYDALKNGIADRGISLSTYTAPKAKDIVGNGDNVDPSHPLYGKIVVFTGALEKMTRKDAMQLVADIGGIPADGITKKTNYLILGNNDYCSSIKGGKSSKQKKAEKMKLDGADIEIMPESVFYDMILDNQ